MSNKKPTPTDTPKTIDSQPSSPSNETEIIQSFCQQFINKLVREDFKDVDINDVLGMSLTNARQALKRVCTHQDNDSLLITAIRLITYGVFIFNKDKNYILPSFWLHDNYNFDPEVTLYFVDKPQDRLPEYKNKPLELVTTFKLRFDISQVSSENDIERIATRIFNRFQNNYKVQKGRLKVDYRDELNKFKTWGYFNSESEAKDYYKDVCYIIGIDYDDNNVYVGKLETESKKVKKIILGRTYYVERKRTGYVYFKKAELSIGSFKTIQLCNTIKVNQNISELIQSFYA